jgi:hypothetical protein
MNTAIDMAQFVAPKSDQLNADDLIAGPLTIRVTRVSANEGSPEQPINIFFDGDDNKPFRPCKSMRRVMIHCWGADAAQYVGRSMTLYRDPKVQFGGMQVGGIRISHMSHIDERKTMALTASKAKRAPFTVDPLAVAAPKPDKPDAAVKWANAYIAKVQEADADELESFVKEKAAKLAELAEKRPDLHEECIAAAASRHSYLAAQDAFSDDDDATVAEVEAEIAEKKGAVG